MRRGCRRRESPFSLQAQALNDPRPFLDFPVHAGGRQLWRVGHEQLSMRTHDVAACGNVRHVGAHLDVDIGEATVSHGHTSLVVGDLLAVGRAVEGLHH